MREEYKLLGLDCISAGRALQLGGLITSEDFKVLAKAAHIFNAVSKAINDATAIAAIAADGSDKMIASKNAALEPCCHCTKRQDCRLFSLLRIETDCWQASTLAFDHNCTLNRCQIVNAILEYELECPRFVNDKAVKSVKI